MWSSEMGQDIRTGHLDIGACGKGYNINRDMWTLKIGKHALSDRITGEAPQLATLIAAMAAVVRSSEKKTTVQDQAMCVASEAVEGLLLLPRALAVAAAATFASNVRSLCEYLGLQLYLVVVVLDCVLL